MSIEKPYDVHDMRQAGWDYDNDRYRTISVISDLSGNTVGVTPDGEIKTTATLSLSGGDLILDIGNVDVLNVYGEVVDLPINNESTITSISVLNDEKINIMGLSAEGCGLGDYILTSSSIVQTRKISNSIDLNFGFYGIVFYGPTVIELKVKNIDSVLTSSRKNKPHTYFGNIFYTIKPV